jgi:hypothetical protein
MWRIENRPLLLFHRVLIAVAMAGAMAGALTGPGLAAQPLPHHRTAAFSPLLRITPY